MIQYKPPVKKPSTIIQNQVKYHGSLRPYLPAKAAAEALELALDELFITILFGIELYCKSSTCLPHLGHTTHYLSIFSPQCLQNLVSTIS